MAEWIWIVLAITLVGVLSTRQAAIAVWAIALGLLTGLWLQFGAPGGFVKTLLFAGIALSVLGSIKPLRRVVLSSFLFKLVKKSLPKMSATEKEALEAGTVSWEGDIFTGTPDFNKLLNLPTVQLSPEEQAFMDGPVKTLCAMIDDWEITHQLTDMPPAMWQYIKDQGFLGMIIPKSYGGLEFSATAQMEVLVRLYGRSITVATTVGVPNSLGPGELLLKYGTEAQKNYYLPRLAKGEEIPCFALTGPTAGSDAASIPDKGVVCKKMIDGVETLGIVLNWNKRYITLCPVATVIGMAFRLFDPDNLLGQGENVGITCALIPSETPGVIKGRRHFPLNTGFMNGPTQGHDVFIPMDYVIGGKEMAGHGWRMLMECLSAGRAISLPSSASGGAQVAALTSGAYARVRRQFNTSIANFEGIEEPLARIAASTYLIDAGLLLATAAIDHGAKPSVAGAILKYHTTERSRLLSLDAMDIHGGKGICLGPNNYMGRGYQGAPIGITVEGANILTRSLIIFGQGAIRCHPYVYKEMQAIQDNDLAGFDQAFFGHMAFVIANSVRTLVFGITDGRGSSAPRGAMKRYYQLISKYSTNLAFLADFAMMVLGGELKRRERISARLGDMLSTLYLCSAVLKRFHEDGEPEADVHLVEFCCEQLLFECETAMAGVINNFRPRWARGILRLMAMPLGARRKKPNDKLSHQVAVLLTKPNETRDRLTRLAFKEAGPNCPVGRLEEAFLKVYAVSDLEKRVLKAARKMGFTGLTLKEHIEDALKTSVITAEEAEQLFEADRLRQEIIAVDDFSDAELRREGKKVSSSKVKAEVA